MITTTSVSSPPRRSARPAAGAGALLTRSALLTAYRRMAPIYDWVFGPVFARGRRQVQAALAPQPGDRILEVGVGTGLSLPAWPREVVVTGIDLSPAMLRRAERRRLRLGLHHVELRELDASATDFATDAFDKIAAMHVVSVVSDLPALLREMRRVCRPGGRIVIVNHFAQSHPWLRRGEQALAPYAGRLGFDPVLPLTRVTEAAGLRIREVRPASWFGYWTLIVAENDK